MPGTELEHMADAWKGEFGNSYTARNFDPVNYVARYGMERWEMFNAVFKNVIKKDAKVLEVGCNVGNQLEVLRKMGFTDLHGIDVNQTAVSIAQGRGFDVSIGDALNIKFDTGSFDLVFTAGLLIHMSPADLPKAISEVCRVSRAYIAGFEYFSEKPEEIPYRDGVWLWKGDFCKEYTAICMNATLAVQKVFKHVDGSGNRDVGFLINKGRSKR